MSDMELNQRNQETELTFIVMRRFTGGFGFMLTEGDHGLCTVADESFDGVKKTLTDWLNEQSPESRELAKTLEFDPRLVTLTIAEFTQLVEGGNAQPNITPLGMIPVGEITDDQQAEELWLRAVAVL